MQNVHLNQLKHLSATLKYNHQHPTFFIDAKWDVVDGLQFDAGAGQHLQLHGRQGGRFKTLREDNKCRL